MKMNRMYSRVMIVVCVCNVASIAIKVYKPQCAYLLCVYGCKALFMNTSFL